MGRDAEIATPAGADPVAALVLGPRPLADMVLVDGKVVVQNGELQTGDVEAIARELAEVRR